MKLMIFSLCDNDFGYTIQRAVEIAVEEGLHEYAGEDCRWWKSVIVKLAASMCGLYRYRDEEALAGTEKYLNEMQVYVTDKFPTSDGVQPLDHDGGSVMLDLDSGFVSTF